MINAYKIAEMVKKGNVGGAIDTAEILAICERHILSTRIKTVKKVAKRAARHCVFTDGELWYFTDMVMAFALKLPLPIEDKGERIYEIIKIINNAYENTRLRGAPPIPVCIDDLNAHIDDSRKAPYRLGDHHLCPKRLRAALVILGGNISAYLPESNRNVVYLESENGCAVVCPLRRVG